MKLSLSSLFHIFRRATWKFPNQGRPNSEPSYTELDVRVKAKQAFSHRWILYQYHFFGIALLAGLSVARYAVIESSWLKGTNFSSSGVLNSILKVGPVTLFSLLRVTRDSYYEPVASGKLKALAELFH